MPHLARLSMRGFSTGLRDQAGGLQNITGKEKTLAFQFPFLFFFKPSQSCGSILSSYSPTYPLNPPFVHPSTYSLNKDSLEATIFQGFPGGATGKEPTCQCRRPKRCQFDSWVGKIPWRRAWQLTPVFLLGESPWTEKPGGLQYMGSQRVRHD